MKRSLLISAFFVAGFFVNTLNAQDIHFSQIQEAPLFMSPANTGFFNGYFRAIANYRNQWASMNKAFQTGAISIDGGLFRSRKRAAFLGMGLTIFNDQAGAAKLRTFTAMLNVSGLVKLGKKSALSVGLAGGTTATNANYDKLTYASQFNGNYIDPTVASGEPIYSQYTTVDVGAGIAYEFRTFSRDQDHDDVKSFKISLGAFHLNRAQQQFGMTSGYRTPVRYTAMVSSIFDIEDTKFSTMPTVMFQQQGTAQELMMGMMMKYRMSTGTKVTGTRVQNAFGIGMYYRNKDAIIPQLTFDIGDYSVGMAYDINVSAYRTASRYFGGFEIALRYNNLASALFETRREFR
jgi:type IX secretion system PorP/SprF family membrane protein